jgi:hypothetical protein
MKNRGMTNSSFPDPVRTTRYSDGLQASSVR